MTLSEDDFLTSLSLETMIAIDSTLGGHLAGRPGSIASNYRKPLGKLCVRPAEDTRDGPTL
jgi:hypothetical protein